MKDRVERILPANQQTSSVYSQDYDCSISPFTWLHEFIFVIEKYLNSKVPQANYTIIYSSVYSTENLHENSLRNLQQLETLLKTGNSSVNKQSYGFLPPSSKEYLKAGNYNVDFTNQFYGIKHFHLCSDDRKRDQLLYYVLDGDCIYFLSIDGHSKLYDQENVEILVREFPEIASKVGIKKMPDMPVGDSFRLSTEELKKHWISGLNSSFIIDGPYYITAHPQTTSRLNTDIINLSNNIMYQFEHALNEFKTKLGEEKSIISLCFEDDNLMKNGIVLIGDEISKNAVEVRIPYLEKLEEVDAFLELN